ncbi:MAG: response regulator [candidate division Zixibacteria bacterium]|nr:response regulator [candidate division Zixibacteria bacterium]MDH3939251.1 response regulator [candidate division Zixibacteria bacterium]MDH4033575.1 response regulator [candidate division Zixibacteria bacterium]
MTNTEPNINGTILVVDDEEVIVSLLSSILEREGYQVHCGRSGREGVEIAMKTHPDLIIMDILMPDLDGYGATRLIKQNPTMQNVPVIFLTGRSAEEDGGKAFANGATTFVRKPFKRRQITDLVKLTMMSATA